jgi:hypothetical protein
MEKYNAKEHGLNASKVALVSGALSDASLSTLQNAFKMAGAVLVVAVDGPADSQDAIASFSCSETIPEQTAEWYKVLSQFLRARADELDSKAAQLERDASGAATQ